VLENNPLTIPSAEIRDIPIVETIIAGETVYTK
jgi:predicted amidohydrolase YtcJ